MVIDAFPDGQQRQIRWQLAGVLRTVITQYLLPRRDGGRVAAVEVVPVTTAVANIMRKGDLHTLPTAINTGRDAGMIPLERSLAKLLDSGVVAQNVVKKIASDRPADLRMDPGAVAAQALAPAARRDDRCAARTGAAVSPEGILTGDHRRT